MGDGWHILTAILAAAAGAPAGWGAAWVARRYGGGVGQAWLIAGGAAAFGWAALVVPVGWVLAASLGLGWALLSLAAIDVAIFRLPDALTLPLIGAGLIVAAALPGAPFLDHLAGAAGGYGVLRLLGWVFRRARGVEGVGLGDAKLLGAAGAWVGWRPLPWVVLIACLAAFAWVAFRVATKGRAALRARIAFGAPLSLALWIVWLHGSPLR
jgi:leader peptidase (prepilin peptidase)/N-methyltransferase